MFAARAALMKSSAVWTPVTYQAVGTGGRTTGGTTASMSTSWTHNCSSSGATTVVIAAVAFGGADTGGFLGDVSCTYGGVAMTAMGAKYGYDVSDQQGYVWFFYMVNPPTGSQTVQANWASGDLKRVIMGNSVSYTGFGSFGTRVNAQGTPTLPSVSLTGANLPTNSMGIAMAVHNSTLTGSNRTQRHLTGATTSSYADYFAIQDVVGDGTTKSFTHTGTSQRWSSIAVPILPV